MEKSLTFHSCFSLYLAKSLLTASRYPTLYNNCILNYFSIPTFTISVDHSDRSSCTFLFCELSSYRYCLQSKDNSATNKYGSQKWNMKGHLLNFLNSKTVSSKFAFDVFLKTTTKSAKFETFKPFLHWHVEGLTMYSIESRHYRMGKYTVCMHVPSSFGPKILLAGEVKGLIQSFSVLS